MKKNAVEQRERLVKSLLTRSGKSDLLRGHHKIVVDFEICNPRQEERYVCIEMYLQFGYAGWLSTFLCINSVRISGEKRDLNLELLVECYLQST